MLNGRIINIILILLPAFFALLILLPLTIGTLSTLLLYGGVDGIFDVINDPYITKVAIFTVFQAVLSTLISTIFAIPIARAFSRRRFYGRDLLLRIFSITLVMPVIVVILGIVIIYGKSGFINDILRHYGFDAGHYLYGLTGILIAHVFFNMPLITRSILNALDTIPPENWRLASQLGMGDMDIFKIIEWPVMRRVLPGIMGVVLMLCFTSFAIVLTLGGGPKATTIEVAIYQAIRFDFDITRAVGLCLMQLFLCGTIAGFLLRIGRNVDFINSEKKLYIRPDIKYLSTKITDILFISLAILFIIPPIIAIIFSGINYDGIKILTEKPMWSAAFYSVIIALSSGILSLILGIGLLVTSRNLRLKYNQIKTSNILDLGGSLILIMPPFVMATGLFLMFRNAVNIFTIAPILIILTNSAMALPFIIRIIGPALYQAGGQYDRLCQNLNISGINKFKFVDWPMVKKPFSMAFAIAVTISIGDLGVVALFGSQDFTTLPLYIYRLTSAYKLDQAASASLILIIICFALFWAIEKICGLKIGNIKD